LPFGKISSYSDGKTGWLQSPQGVMPLPAEVLKQAQGEMFRDLMHTIIADRASSVQVNAVGRNAVQISSRDGNNVKIEFDEATGLPAREIYQEAGQNGPAEVVESFSDWREAGGIKVPFKIQIQQGGKPLGDLTVQEYKFNSGLKVEELSQKP
jgi:hypothetical protein